jgi:YebC/PmpR family DNA-binding regulatory protein
MGRAFEFRRARKEKRWDWMAKTFTRFGKEIALAVKQGGPDPETNPRLRAAIQNAKGANMPKDKIEGAIKRASDKGQKALEEVVYEGKGPYGIGIIVETATDNPTRTVANIRMYFTRGGGELGKTGSLDYLFERKGSFKFPKGDFDMEELELELIDYGADEIFEADGEVNVYTSFQDYGKMQKALEEKGINVTNSELVRIPVSVTELTEEQQKEVEELIDKLEQDDDVQNVFHNMK